jgi:hypothetical protein
VTIGSQDELIIRRWHEKLSGKTGDQNITSQLEKVFKKSDNPELQETAREAVMRNWERRH